MNKLILVGAALVASPLAAQQTATTPGTPAQTTAPSTSMPAQSTSQSMTPADPAQTAPATEQPAATGDQVAGVVDKDFATYDKDGNGALSRTEFSAWMTALKTSSADAKAPDKKWLGTAFTQADTDKSKSVSKEELTGFLSQKS